MTSDSNQQDRHKKRMQRQKAVVDSAVEKASKDQGVLLVHTGNGKGKSSSAFGMAARALGHGLHVGVVQFIKGKMSTGEELFFQKTPGISFHAMGDGFTWDTQDNEQDKRTTETAWKKAVEFLTDEETHLVILDELNIALKLNLLPIATVIDQLNARPQHQHVVITGRAAKTEIIEIADTVTEMKDIKHAFRAGIQAQKGVEL